MDDTANGLSLGTLRTSSATLMIDRLGSQFRQTLETGARVQRYYLAAEAVGVPRGVALDLLHLAQGHRAGSTPTEADIEAAREAVLTHALSGAVPMSNDLRATVDRLASTTGYSSADLTSAVETLRGVVDPWDDDRINRALPRVAQMAGGSPFRLSDVALMVRHAVI